MLKFTPLEFETYLSFERVRVHLWLKFTPLEFETNFGISSLIGMKTVKIYSVGV